MEKLQTTADNLSKLADLSTGSGLQNYYKGNAVSLYNAPYKQKISNAETGVDLWKDALSKDAEGKALMAKIKSGGNIVNEYQAWKKKHTPSTAFAQFISQYHTAYKNLYNDDTINTAKLDYINNKDNVYTKKVLPLANGTYSGISKYASGKTLLDDIKNSRSITASLKDFKAEYKKKTGKEISDSFINNLIKPYLQYYNSRTKWNELAGIRNATGEVPKDPLAYAQQQAQKTLDNSSYQLELRNKEYEETKTNADKAAKEATASNKKLTDAQTKALKSTKDANIIKAIKNQQAVDLSKYKDKNSAEYKALKDYNDALDDNNDKVIRNEAAMEALSQAEQDAFVASVEHAEAMLEYAKKTQQNISDYYGYYGDYKEAAIEHAQKTRLDNNGNERENSKGTYLGGLHVGRTDAKLYGEWTDAISYSEKKSSELNKNLEKLVKDGYIKQGSKEWAEMKEEIWKAEEHTEELKQTAYDAHLEYMFDSAIKRADMFIDRLKAIQGIITNEMMYDRDTGKLTEMGWFNIALDVRQMQQGAWELKKFYAERDDILKEYKNRNDGRDYVFGTDDYIDGKLEEVNGKINQGISNAISYKNAILDAIKSQANAELNAIKKVISARKKALKEKEDYYDYDKKLKDKTKDIELLEALIAALEGVTNAEDKARRAKLQDELQKEREDLEETVRDHVYNIQVQGLDDLVEKLDEDMEKYLYDLMSSIDNMNAAISKLIDAGELNVETINKLIGYAQGQAWNAYSSEKGNVLQYAKGTNYHPGGPAIVNEKGSGELIQLPDGTLLMPYAPKGMKVMPENMVKNAFVVANGYDAIGNAIANTAMQVTPVSSAGIGGGNTVINSSINIDGNVDHHTFDELKQYIESNNYKSSVTNYAVKEISRDARMSGRKVTF